MWGVCNRVLWGEQCIVVGKKVDTYLESAEAAAAAAVAAVSMSGLTVYVCCVVFRGGRYRRAEWEGG